MRTAQLTPREKRSVFHHIIDELDRLQALISGAMIPELGVTYRVSYNMYVKQLKKIARQTNDSRRIEFADKYKDLPVYGNFSTADYFVRNH